MYRRYRAQVDLDIGRAAFGKVDRSGRGRIDGVAVIGDRVHGIQFRIGGGRPLREAIIEGSLSRVRPILMTMFTAVLGSFPLAIGLGKGDELAQPLAVVTFGGLFVSTLLTLLIIPSLYYMLSKWQSSRSKPGTQLKAVAA